MILDPLYFCTENGPMKRTEAYFKGYKDHELFYQSWFPNKPVGTLVVTHGLGEHSECYKRLAEGLSDQNWTIHAWDLRGHGRSEGNRGVINSFKEYTEDLKYLVDHLQEQKPKHKMILLGHSMGALINLRAVLDHGDMGFKALALSSPAVGLNLRIPEVKKTAAKLLAKYAPTFTLYNEVLFKDLTRDKAVIEEYSRDPLRHDRTTALLYLQAMENMSHVIENAEKIRLPVLLQQAGDDRVVNREASRMLYDRLGSEDKDWIIYEGFKHEIFNEIDRGRVFQDLKKWLSRWE
jgi:alpha-beta hydrolase superfamily lysophospholipase